MTSSNPLLPFLRTGRPLVLDGGLATTLEDRGHDLDDDLWSARVLLTDPDAVAAVHTAFLEAGADVIATATYQATLQGLALGGMDTARAEGFLRDAVDLAVEARDRFWDLGARDEGGAPGDSGEPGGRGDSDQAGVPGVHAHAPPDPGGRLRPLVAASVGPYGAFLADGSEYVGRYGIGEAALRDFHARRWEILADSPADLLACETLPSATEARVLLDLLADEPGRWAWISFSCPDDAHISDGTPVEVVARDCHGRPGLAGLGINCTDPEHLPGLLDRVRGVTDLPLLVYPNSGERYRPSTRTWDPAPASVDWEAAARAWVAHGARGVGGCCRVGPEEVRRIRAGVTS